MSHDPCIDPACTSCSTRKFAHLHQHTQYSLLDGAAKLRDLLKWVKEVTPNDPACAITDHGNMHGAVHFFNYAQQMGVKPIIGYEAYVVPGMGTRRDKKPGQSGEKGIFHLTMLARDFEGYQNLCRLTSRGYTEGYYYKPRIDHELLLEHHKGIIAFSGCLGAEVPQLIMQDRLEQAKERLLWYQSLFRENYFIEVQDHGIPEQVRVNEVLRTWAKELGIGMVATNDGHYVKREDAKPHDALLAIQTKATLADENRFKFPCEEFYVKSLDEMQQALPVDVWGEEPFDNTADIARMCNVELPVGKKRVYQMPALPIPEGRTMSEELRVQTYRGMMKRYPEHLTEPLIREYICQSWEKVQQDEALKAYYQAIYEPKLDGEKFTEEKFTAIDFAGHTSKLKKRLPNFRPQTADFETLYAAMAFMGSLWEDLGKAVGEKYTRYPALEELEQRCKDGECMEGFSEDQYNHAVVLLRRAEYELSVINNMGFPDYFLIVADYINWAKDHDISVGPGRGSGAGSLVAYAIRITNLDPLEFELLFERFLNPDRISMPDFDIDFNDQRREEVIAYVREKYGDDKVAQIATFGTLSSKACLKDVARVMGVVYADVDKVSKLIPVKFGKSYSLEQARESVPDIQDMLKANQDLAAAYEFAQKLEGLTRHASVHAAGVVIGRDNLTDLVPLMRDNSGEGIVCQYDMKACEDIGLIKMDFLGLRTLSFLDEARKILKDSKNININFDEIPFDDEATFDLMGRGECKGIFQFEGGGIADATRRMKPKRLADLVAMSALYRPGPMENIPTYIRRHHGQEPVTYPDFPTSEKWLEPILRETYGIPVYQEQIMQIASTVAGYTLGGADLLRRAMGKKDANEMKNQRILFVKGSKENGVPEEESNKLFDLLEKFANYGFNKSHSAAYGVISYQTAWLKANHPVEFMAALLTVERRDSDKVSEYVSDARKMGVVVLPPSINHSGADFKVVKGQIYFGLYAIKGLGENAVEFILAEKTHHGPYKSLPDFCKRVSSKVANRKALENLIKGGAFDAFGDRKALLESVEEALSFGQASQQDNGMDSLFGAATTMPEPKLKQVAPFTELEKLSAEKEALGLYISGHPLEQYEGLREAASCTILNLETYFQQNRPGNGRLKVVLAGMLEAIVKKPTKSGGMMAKFNLADESGVLELVAFGKAYERVQHKLIPDSPALVIVDLDDSEGSIRAIAEEIVTIENLIDVPKVAWLNLDLDQTDNDALRELASFMDEYAGSLPVRMKVSGNGMFASLEVSGMKISPDGIKALSSTFKWVDASVAYDNSTILSKFAPKPRWQGKPSGGFQNHQA
ncbi:DNA polymerase III subunit alpha [Deinococcus roseus]|uniref:DNA-directed DNA polymerase n=1 Tax=Deinococcus roseus TaxID=392414 RepID=A0ABQ2D1J0_9DEIO|nr:DNA polymerase III subunit alpha [Deinococcus roseus]GGJ41709.1 DNA polymerase III subunit alpha [Deinococcus roseus]